MKVKVIKILALPLLLCVLLISCDRDKPTQSTTIDLAKALLSSLVKQNVILAGGINFATGKPVVFSPKTGMEIKPLSTYSDSNKRINPIEIVEGDNSMAINNAIASTRQVINGQIKKDGKVIPARIFVTVDILFKGSNCDYRAVGGEWFICCDDICTQL